MNGIRRRVRRSWWGLILAEHDTEPIELAGGVLKLALGLWLLLPFDTFRSSPTFEAIGVMPEWVWGLGFLAIGTFHLRVLRSGAIARRRVGCLVGFLVWFSFSLVFLASNPPALGWILFMGAAIGQGWAWIRLGCARRACP